MQEPDAGTSAPPVDAGTTTMNPPAGGGGGTTSAEQDPMEAPARGCTTAPGIVLLAFAVWARRR
jgi:hypothetical protein